MPAQAQAGVPGMPDMKVSVRQLFGIDTDFEAPAYSQPDDHVRAFNASYNYFEGMSNTDIEAYQKDSVIGHRPTWKAGANAWAHGTRYGGGTHPGSRQGTHDPHAFFVWREERTATGGTPRRKLKPLELKSLEALNLGATAAREEIKARFKELVKRHHPDSNGGDTRSEDKLREIIQAYNYLKQAGLV